MKLDTTAASLRQVKKKYTKRFVWNCMSAFYASSFKKGTSFPFEQ